METLTSSEAVNWREGRRLRALELRRQGWTQQAIADALGVTQGAVSQWLSRALREGPQALRAKKPTGALPRLTAEQFARIPALLSLGAEFWGHRGDLWTCPRVAALIERVFGVRYHDAHVSRLLARLGWSLQKPTRRATQRDEEAIREWVEDRWPLLKNGPQRKADVCSSSTSPASTCCRSSRGPTPRGAARPCSTRG